MYHNVYASGPLPDDTDHEAIADAVESALLDQLGGAGQGIEVEINGDQLRAYLSSSDDTRALEAQLQDLQLTGSDWEFSFDQVEVD